MVQLNERQYNIDYTPDKLMKKPIYQGNCIDCEHEPTFDEQLKQGLVCKSEVDCENGSCYKPVFCESKKHQVKVDGK